MGLRPTAMLLVQVLARMLVAAAWLSGLGARRSCWTVACTWATRTHAGDAAPAPSREGIPWRSCAVQQRSTDSGSILASSFAPWHGCHVCGLTLPTVCAVLPPPLPKQDRFPDFSLLGPPDPDYTSVIDAVLISHFHMDHVGALPYFTEVPWGRDTRQMQA